MTDAPEQKAEELHIQPAGEPSHVKNDGHGPRDSNPQYSRKQWQAMKKRRKQAQRSRRRNRA